MKGGNRKKTKSRSNAFGNRLNAFAFSLFPFHQEGHICYKVIIRYYARSNWLDYRAVLDETVN